MLTITYHDHDGPFAQVTQASLEAPLPEWNRGYQLLRLMGWKTQTGLGKSGQGIVDPVRIGEQHGTLGLGKVRRVCEREERRLKARRGGGEEVVRRRGGEGR